MLISHKFFHFFPRKFQNHTAFRKTAKMAKFVFSKHEIWETYEMAKFRRRNIRDEISPLRYLVESQQKKFE